MFVQAPLWRGTRIRGRYWGLGDTCGSDPACLASVTDSFGNTVLPADVALALEGGQAGPALGSGGQMAAAVNQAALAVGQQSTMSLLFWGGVAVAAGVVVAGIFGGHR